MVTCGGIGGSSVDNTVIVSCRSNDDGPAYVDVITRNGELVRMVTDGQKIKNNSPN
jgi:hypothetical protein